MTVVVLGASPKEDRYSNKAVKLLLEYGHEVIPVHPVAAAVHDLPCIKKLGDITCPVHTLTLYLGPSASTPLQQQIIDLHPQRIIFNPGTENPDLETAARAAGIEVLEACTLVLLKTGRFEE